VGGSWAGAARAIATARRARRRGGRGGAPAGALPPQFDAPQSDRDLRGAGGRPAGAAGRGRRPRHRRCAMAGLRARRDPAATPAFARLPRRPTGPWNPRTTPWRRGGDGGPPRRANRAAPADHRLAPPPPVQAPDPAKHYGVATKLATPLAAKDGLAFQYDLKLADGVTCGGAYMKLMSGADFEPEKLGEASPFSIMFGPDKCGATNKVHVIVRHAAPNGTVEEKHLASPPLVETDTLTHTYTLLLHPANGTYDVLVDGVSKKSGSLSEDFEPPFVPPKEVDDAKDTKPSTWVDVARIPDPAAKKPADWDEDAPRTVPDAAAVKPDGWLDDEPLQVDDPDATQPEDWDEEEDGAWEAPQVPNPKCAAGPGCGEWVRPTIPNPAYKGAWVAPMIDNPAYKGPWAPRKVANPDFYEDAAPLANVAPVGGVALEIWTMDKGYTFSNIVLSADAADAAAARESTAAARAEEKAAADAAAAAAAKKAETKAEPGPSLAERVQGLFDEGAPLASLADAAEPLLDALDTHEWLAWVVVALPALLVLAPVALLTRGGKKGGKAGKAASNKKRDVTGADDAASGADAAVAAGGDDADAAATPGPRRRAARRDA